MNAIMDAAELQHGEVIACDAAQGVFAYTKQLYGVEHEYTFTVRDMPAARSSLRIDVAGDLSDPALQIHRQFALIESLMIV
jgi:hypothetical protein